jgi:integrase
MPKKKTDIKIISYKGYSIRKLSDKCFLLDYMVKGKRNRTHHKTLAGAKSIIDAIDTKRTNQGIEALELGDKTRIEVKEALTKLNGRATISEVVSYWLERHPDTGAETWHQVAERYLAEMETNERRKSSVIDKRLKFSILEKPLANPVMCAVDKATLKKAVDVLSAERNWSDQTKGKYLSAGLTLIEFFKGNGKQKRKKDETPPIVWSADFIEKMMHEAEEHVPRLVPALAIMTFAGIRPNEALQLSWDAVNFTDGHISLTGKETKTHTTRHVTIKPNLLAWLQAYKGIGKISSSPTSQRYDREKLMKKLSITEWPNDVLRHTAATMMYAQSKDVNVTCEQLGHFGGAGMFLRHYKGLAPKPEEVTKFWEIKPAPKMNPDTVPPGD